MSVERKFIESFSELLDQIPTDSEAFILTKRLLEYFQQFFPTLREANPDELQNLIMKWEDPPPLFNEIGKIVRSFYDQMKVIRADIPERLGEIAHHNMEDAGIRLQNIVEMTEKAANKTMDLSEEILNSLDDRAESYKTTLELIGSALETELPLEVIDVLKAAQSTLQSHKEGDDQCRGKLTDILVAQDYQDLTGQVINKIVSLLDSLEQELVGLIETFGKAYVKKDMHAEELKGPMLQGAEDKQSQIDTDKLLASLGF